MIETDLSLDCIHLQSCVSAIPRYALMEALLSPTTAVASYRLLPPTPYPLPPLQWSPTGCYTPPYSLPPLQWSPTGCYTPLTPSHHYNGVLQAVTPPPPLLSPITTMESYRLLPLPPLLSPTTTMESYRLLPPSPPLLSPTTTMES